MPKEESDYSCLTAPRVNPAPDVVQSDFRNVSGRVFVIGDVHGAPAFNDVLESLRENDRLVLVGDLMDRGPDTFKILQAIVNDPLKDKIVAVRGNHEEMFLQYIAARRKWEKNKETNPDFHLDDKEIAQNIRPFIFNGGDWAEGKTLAELESIADYVDQLPYIRQVLLPNDRKFLVAHADMSMISDADVEELLNRKSEKKLTDTEKAALTWARPGSREISYDKYPKVRKSDNTRVYVGHDITTKSDVVVIRKDTNHVNLDFGGCYAGPLVGVEHPNKAVVFGVFKPNYDSTRFFKQLVELHRHMGAIEFHTIETFEAYKNYLINTPELIRTCGLDLSNQDLSTNTSLAGADLTGAKISADQLYYLIFKYKNLLRNVRLDNEQLSREQVEMLIRFGLKHLLKNTNLSGVNLSGLDLSGADLSGADLSGADLSGVIIKNTKFDNVSVDDKTSFQKTTIPAEEFLALLNSDEHNTLRFEHCGIALPKNGEMAVFYERIQIINKTFSNVTFKHQITDAKKYPEFEGNTRFTECQFTDCKFVGNGGKISFNQCTLKLSEFSGDCSQYNFSSQGNKINTCDTCDFTKTEKLPTFDPKTDFGQSKFGLQQFEEMTGLGEQKKAIAENNKIGDLIPIHIPESVSIFNADFGSSLPLSTEDIEVLSTSSCSIDLTGTTVSSGLATSLQSAIQASSNNEFKTTCQLTADLNKEILKNNKTFQEDSWKHISNFILSGKISLSYKEAHSLDLQRFDLRNATFKDFQVFAHANLEGAKLNRTQIQQRLAINRIDNIDGVDLCGENLTGLNFLTVPFETFKTIHFDNATLDRVRVTPEQLNCLIEKNIRITNPILSAPSAKDQVQLEIKHISTEMKMDVREIPKASLGNIFIGEINKKLQIEITPEQVIYFLTKENLSNCKLTSSGDLKKLCTLLKEKLNTNDKPKNLHELLEFIVNQAKQLNVTVDFSGVNFSGCDFSGLDLSHFKLHNCNLSYAKFNNAQLTSVDLSGSNTENANFDNAIINKGTNFKGCKNFSKVASVQYAVLGRDGGLPAILNVSPKAFLEMVDLKYAELLKYEKNPARHNFLHNLMKSSSTEFEKMAAILEHARKEPRSLTALVLEQAVITLAEIHKLAVVSPVLDTKEKLNDPERRVKEGKVISTPELSKAIQTPTEKLRPHSTKRVGFFNNVPPPGTTAPDNEDNKKKEPKGP